MPPSEAGAGRLSVHLQDSKAHRLAGDGISGKHHKRPKPPQLCLSTEDGTAGRSPCGSGTVIQVGRKAATPHAK